MWKQSNRRRTNSDTAAASVTAPIFGYSSPQDLRSACNADPRGGCKLARARSWDVCTSALRVGGGGWRWRVWTLHRYHTSDSTAVDRTVRLLWTAGLRRPVMRTMRIARKVSHRKTVPDSSAAIREDRTAAEDVRIRFRWAWSWIPTSFWSLHGSWWCGDYFLLCPVWQAVHASVSSQQLWLQNKLEHV